VPKNKISIKEDCRKVFKYFLFILIMVEEKFNLVFSGKQVFGEDCEESRKYYDQSRFGEIVKGKFQYSLVEGLYLVEKNKIEVLDGRGKKLKINDYVKKAKKAEPNFWVRYCVFGDMRSRGYVVKTALKFGADFRVYDRGVKPGEDHAKWILYPVNEGSVMTWYEFSAKNRVAHSTRKRLLLGVVDDEGDVTYYEIAWKRP
jgi:tRNA-intron endonuclease, archaea type